MSNGEAPIARDSPGSKQAAAGKLMGPSVRDGTPPAQEDFTGWQDAPFLLRPRPLGYQRCEEQDWRRVGVNTGRCAQKVQELHKNFACTVWLLWF